MIDNKVLRAPGLTEAMLCHLDGDSVASQLDYRCQEARAWRASPIAGRGIVALWECGMVLDYFNPANGRFRRYRFEPSCAALAIGEMARRKHRDSWVLAA